MAAIPMGTDTESIGIIVPGNVIPAAAGAVTAEIACVLCAVLGAVASTVAST